MKFSRRLLAASIGVLIFCSFLNAQQPSVSASSAVVPRLVNFSGKTTDAQGKVVTGIAGATFAIYQEQSGGAPLWMETQNVRADAKGNYTVQLGATKPDGLPLDLFTSGEARWLAVAINGQSEQPRILLLSVPYALKAADAETLGGKPLSAFQLAAPQSYNGSSQSVQPATEQPNEIRCSGNAACKASAIPVFTTNGGSAKVGSSIISESATTIAIAGSLEVSQPDFLTIMEQGPESGVGTALEMQTTGTGGMFWQILNTGASASQGANKLNFRNDSAGLDVMTLTASGQVGIGTTSPIATLDVQGNASQARTAGGIVKAMFLFSPFNGGGFPSCYNSTLSGAAATTPPCGFTIIDNFKGDYIIDLGFQIDDRILSATGGASAAFMVAACTDIEGSCQNQALLTPNRVELTNAFINSCGGSGCSFLFFDNKIHLIVY